MHRLVHFAEDGDTSGFFPALAKYHSRQKFEMTFATLKPMAPWLEAFMHERKVETFACGARGRLQYPLSLLGLIRHLRTSRCEIFHAHLFDPSVVGLTAARLVGTRARILTRHYSNYHTRINRPLHVELDRWCTLSAHRVIAVSNETADHLIRVEGAPVSKVTAIHNGIDFERVRVSGPDAGSNLRRELDLGETFTFLVAGRLHPEKGYEPLFQAVQRLKARATRPFVVLAAGRGPFLNRYQEQVASLGLGNQVRFLGFRSDLADLMVASNVFVLPSVAESFGLVLAEALYLGRPVLATRVGGIPEIVDDGRDGLLVPPGDPLALSHAMESFLRGEVELPGQGKAAIEKVRARFSFEEMMRKYEAVYDHVLGEDR